MQKNTSHKIIAITFILMSLLTSACGGGGGGDSAPVAPAEDTVIKGKA